ncbi:aldehyde reductase II [Pyrenophora seminiperda CCB06]|uniref:Aldehyde reductase II n=1 Tax=Pyrenophora seminiperda CCB06 TaxID=1302712 RepID=A0A3M7MAJ4_9PLEO|nr:aldehyde reductase II [Pyrenophora seminiperda CCB06]
MPGFIAAHTLDVLLDHGHSVVTTVRTQEKADKIKESYKSLVDKGQLGFAIVPDIAQPDAFEKAVVSDPPFEVVLHTASPFHYNVTDVKKDLLDPAIIGTTSILKSIKAHAPSVKHVVVTSSYAAIVHPHKGYWPGHVYSEDDWDPITLEEATENPMTGYRASKTFAEKAAWDFVENEKPNFSLSTINPPMVFGPIVHALDSLDNMNTSNKFMLSVAQGKCKDEIPKNMPPQHLWVDVRDVAEAHVAAFEKPEAANKRFFVTAGYYSNKDICQAIKKNFPELKDLPTDSTPGGDYPEGVPGKAVVRTLASRYILLSSISRLKKPINRKHVAIAQQFVEFYYKTFDENRAALASLYSQKENSMLTFEAQGTQGSAAIVEKLQHRTDTVDAQPSADDGILVLLGGEDRPMNFTQSFQLKNDGGSWYVLNDVFRLVYPAA